MSKQEDSGQACEVQQVRAISEFKGEDVTDLSFPVGETIEVTRKDGAGWAYGNIKDGASGWFPLEHVELIHDKAVAEVGVKTGETALDAFIKEAKEKGGGGPRKIPNLNKKMTLVNFLNERPMVEQLVEKNILPPSEITEQVAAAQKRLLKNQKKGAKKERAEALVESLGKGWLPSNALNLTEDQIDRLAVEVLLQIPLIKQKHHFSSYENVFTGATLVQHLKAGGPSIIPSWQDGIPNEQVVALAGNLIEKNLIFNVVSPSKTGFKSKNLYQLTRNLTDYSYLNLNKICHAAPQPVNAYKESITLVGELIEAMKKYLPSDFASLRSSPEVYAFSLHLACLQSADLDELSDNEKRVFWINLFNCLILYAHIKFTPPTSALEKRFMYENCYIYFNKKRYSIQEVQSEVLKFATKEDPMVYFCLSDGTDSTPATFIFSTGNYEDTKTFAARHYLARALVYNASNYEIKYPRIVQQLWKELKLKKEDLLTVITPYLSRDRREEIAEITGIGQEFDIGFLPYSYQPCYIFEEDSPLSPR